MTKQKSLLRRTNAAAGRKAAATAASAVHNIGGGSAPTTTVIKAVEMPVEFLRWFLSQTSEDYHVPSAADYSPEAAAGEERETAVRRVNADVQATKDDFAAFQAWVRGVVENNNGRVVLGRSANPKELQEIIDGEWALARRELAGDDYDDVTDTEEGGEGAAMAASSSSSKKVKVLRGPHRPCRHRIHDAIDGSMAVVARSAILPCRVDGSMAAVARSAVLPLAPPLRRGVALTGRYAGLPPLTSLQLHGP